MEEYVEIIENDEEEIIEISEDISYEKIPVVSKLPLASELYRGSFKILNNGEKDTLYICLKINQIYEWVNVLSGNGGNTDTEDDTLPILDKAILGTMILQ